MIYHFKFFNYRQSGVDTFKLTKEDFSSYITVENFITLVNIMAVYSTFIVTEAYRYAALTYINKMGYISQVTLYSTLHGFFVIIIIMIFEEASSFDYVFATMVTLAYLWVYSSKFFHTRAGKKSTKGKIVKFKRVLHAFDEVTLIQSVSEISISKSYFSNELDDKNKKEARSTMSFEYLTGFGASSSKDNGTDIVLRYTDSKLSGSQNKNKKEKNGNNLVPLNNSHKDLYKTQDNKNKLTKSNDIRLTGSVNFYADESSENSN